MASSNTGASKPASGPLVRPQVFSIAGGACFVDTLAEGLLARFGGAPDVLADLLILLPTRRAARSLREAFLRLSGGAPLLLPRMMPLGDVDEDELTLAGGELGEDGDAGIPPAIGETKRLAMLARAVRAWIEAERRAGADFAWADATPAQALQLAGELARLLDQMQTENVPLEQLGGLVGGDLAHHWQSTVKFLGLIGEHWKNILDKEHALDPAARRNLLLQRQAALWQASPPAFPVIAAGSTGSIPATRALLQVVARLPKGAVVLPGLDRALDEGAWRAIEETHPQFGLRELLQALEIERASVLDWHAPAAAPPGPRNLLLSTALAPQGANWGAMQQDGDPLADVERADCATPQHEALAIALALRGALETEGETAALVTPDRDLAGRVAAELRRWDIEIDDSGGTPLERTPPLVFAGLALDAIARRFAPVPLLALLKHPFATLGLAREQTLARTRLLDRQVLRGPAPEPDIAGLRALLPGALQPAELADIEDLVGRLERACAPLLARPPEGRAPCTEWLAATLEAVEALAATDAESGAAILWRGEDGEAAAALLADLRRAAGDIGVVTARDWPALFAQLIAGKVLRPRHGRHPRLAILGPLEARLQRFDLVALGGLNEGTWPQEVDSGPWLSRPMRRQLGLPLPERRIGQAAHDFVQSFAARRVLLTRAERVEGTPTVPSRLLVKIDALLKYEPDRPETMPGYRRRGQRWARWAEALDRPASIEPRDPPTPRPAPAHRPRRLSVTEIELWRRDPYALYARRILDLRPLDPLEQEPGAAERGTVIHDILRRFIEEFPDTLPKDAEARLIGIGERQFAELMKRPGERAFWWPRFLALARWFVATERGRRGDGLHNVLSEQRGQFTFRAPGGDFTLTAKADRIDARPDGGIEIIDYKTGATPSPEEIAAGYAPQLPLEGVIAESGRFALKGAKGRIAVASLAYWVVNGREEGGKIVPIKDAKTRIDAARAGIRQLVERFDRQETPYLPQPQPRFAGRFNDYQHLERIAEWSGKDPDRGGGQ